MVCNKWDIVYFNCRREFSVKSWQGSSWIELPATNCTCNLAYLCRCLRTVTDAVCSPLCPVFPHLACVCFSDDDSAFSFHWGRGCQLSEHALQIMPVKQQPWLSASAFCGDGKVLSQLSSSGRHSLHFTTGCSGVAQERIAEFLVSINRNLNSHSWLVSGYCIIYSPRWPYSISFIVFIGHVWFSHTNNSLFTFKGPFMFGKNVSVQTSFFFGHM